MANPTIGWVKSGRTHNSFKVAWNRISGEVYVSYAGWTYVGKAYTAADAMTRAEAWLYNK